jgi:Uma2 family endonuclease
MAVQSKYTFEAFIELPENTNRLFELINREIIEKVPTPIHSYIVALLHGLMFMFLQKHPIGWTAIEVRCQILEDDENDRIPDLAFIRKAPGRSVAGKALTYIPDLVVEVQSPGQTKEFMRAKAGFYLKHGGHIVWLIYPELQIIEVLTSKGRQSLEKSNMLDGGDVLPGFTVPVEQLFTLPDEE